MDQKLFEKLLTEMAEWEYPMAMDSAADTYKIRKLIKKMKKDGISDEDIQEALTEYRNDTYPAKLIKIIPQPLDCPDCGQHCPTGRTVDYRLYKGKKGQTKWCGKCHVCKKQTNPTTGEYNLSNMVAANTWWEWIRTTGVEKPRKPEVAKINPEDLKKKYGLDFLD